MIGPVTGVEGGELVVFEDKIGDTYSLSLVTPAEKLKQIVE